MWLLRVAEDLTHVRKYKTNKMNKLHLMRIMIVCLSMATLGLRVILDIIVVIIEIFNQDKTTSAIVKRN